MADKNGPKSISATAEQGKELDALRRVTEANITNDPKSRDAEIAKYNKAMDAHRARFEAEDMATKRAAGAADKAVSSAQNKGQLSGMDRVKAGIAARASGSAGGGGGVGRLEDRNPIARDGMFKKGGRVTGYKGYGKAKKV